MTLHYPDTDAAPTTYGAAPRNDLATPHAADTVADDTIVPIYARKPVRKSYNKKLLMAVPVVLALGIGAWALTMGEANRPANDADTEGLTTSRLDVAQPISPEVDVPAVTEAMPAEAAPVVAAPAASVAPPPAARVARAATPAPTARRTAAPARRAPAPAAAAPAAVPASPQPYSSPALTTVITEPAPVAAPPPIIAPTPVLPTDPAPTATPPGG